MNWRFVSVGKKKTTHQFVIEVSIVFGEGAKISSVIGKKERGKCCGEFKTENMD